MNSHPDKLKTRHKLGLFVTTILIGTALMLGEPVRNTLGAVIIGFALTWAYGSSSRALRFCLALIAIAMLLSPVLISFHAHYETVRAHEKSVSAFQTQIPRLVSEHPDLTAGLMSPPSGFVPERPPVVLDFSKAQPIAPGDRIPAGALVGEDVPSIGLITFPVGASSKDKAQILRKSYPEKAPEWYLQALDAGVDSSALAFPNIPTEIPPPFSLSSAVLGGAVLEIPALVLTVLFVESLLADKKEGPDTPAPIDVNH